MREIKFRAWDKEADEMIYQGNNSTLNNSAMNVRFVFDEMGAGLIAFGYMADEGAEVKEFELMQYTGLKDSNGNEIYEGDIVQFYNTLTELGTKETKALEYKDGSFGFSNCTEFNMWIPIKGMMIIHRAEVIGNIYENPELLKGE